MTPALHKETLTGIALAGAIAVVLSFCLGNAAVALGAVAGTLVTVANWYAMGYIARRMQARSGGPGLLVAKMGALFGVCYLLIAVLGLDAIGVASGLSSLVVGIVYGAVRTMNDASLSPAEGT